MEVTGKDRGMKRPLEVGDRITKIEEQLTKKGRK